jgi:hypothetical protein
MHRLLVIGLLAAALPARAQLTLESAQVVPPASIIHDGTRAGLKSRQLVATGDSIRTGGNGTVNLRFAGDGVLSVGNASQLFIHSAEPAIPGRGALLRLQLLHGELALEAYPAANSPPQDYRLNLGPLRVRALGADLWAYASDSGEVVCLRQGALEVVGDAGAQRLDVPGDCLLHNTGGALLAQHVEEANLKARLLDGTGADGVADTALSAPDATPPKKLAGAKRWAVVVASFPDRSTAEGIVRKLSKQGLSAEIRAGENAAANYRVSVGDYRSRNEASRAALQLQRKHHLKGAWVAAIP